ncbi:glycoside hydrolase family 99-like domain-containing protein [Schumannella luteola]
MTGRSLKIRAGAPEGWAGMTPIEGPFPRVGIVLHVFYPELLDELIDGLSEMPVEFDLLVTNASGEDLQIDEARMPQLREARVLPVENRGRDILPLVHLVNAGLLNPYEVIGKFHTKRSTWRAEHPELDGTGDDWRSSLLGDLLTGDAARHALSRLAANPDVGIVTSTASVLGPEFWGDNEDVARELLLRLQLPLEPASLRFAAGSMYWVRGFVLQGLWGLALTASDFEEEAGHTNGTVAHAMERLIGVLAAEAGLRVVETGGAVDADAWQRFAPDADVRPLARAVPFYLPQFHPFPENDAWWGKGFTEWSNVAAGRPVYLGHTQPFLPADLGFYDLRADWVQPAQEELARGAGIDGFMVYHYWFAGTTLMRLPVDTLAASGSTPFCIMWANENWTRRWDGEDAEVLIEQRHNDVPAKKFIDSVMDLLTHENYLRVGGKPVLAVYRIGQLPKLNKVLTEWRKAAADAGLPGLTILTVDVGAGMQGILDEPSEHGLDGVLEFPPHRHHWALEPSILELDPRFEGTVLSYRMMADAAIERVAEGIAPDRYPGVMAGFDNTARRQWASTVWHGANPYTYRRWLRATVDALAERDADDRVVFINAWNEWAESAVLEPSQRFGHTFLLATRDALHA